MLIAQYSISKIRINSPQEKKTGRIFLALLFSPSERNVLYKNFRQPLVALVAKHKKSFSARAWAVLMQDMVQQL